MIRRNGLDENALDEKALDENWAHDRVHHVDDPAFDYPD